MKKLMAFSALLFASLVFAEQDVARHQFTSNIADREPVDALTDAMNVNPLYFFTELKGFQNSAVTHRWIYEGKVMAEVNFSVGGPRWRVYSSKQLLPEWDGEWTVEVVDWQGKVLTSDTIAINVD
ncbi:DUF2914 domain-containing protein [Reinekea sp. G2M2-21]|uniref:DUF2914 domain-containing protein n=1 Tax=Reinekea sp. G2M2-21 TaxID=2788942 RepID=UPI0018AADA0F|nr:DUF2914 domain-containing protein [Reinekea sp. G2M2-21]